MLKAVSDYFRSQQGIYLLTMALIDREWVSIGNDFDAGWERVGPRMELLLGSAQLRAARDGLGYVPEALKQQRINIRAQATIDPKSFAGRSYSLDGLFTGSLERLLYGAVVKARTADVESFEARLKIGSDWLKPVVQTQIADASREAAGVAVIVRPHVGYTRLVNPPCCKRCAPLAGKFFKSNTGFARHPGCDCRHVPSTEANWTDVGSFIGPSDVRDLTKAERHAIDDGADMNQVLNTKRAGQLSDDGMTTREGTTKRGFAGARLAAASGAEGAKKGKYTTATKARLTPKGIYTLAGDDRGEALKLLREYGYIVSPAA